MPVYLIVLLAAAGGVGAYELVRHYRAQSSDTPADACPTDAQLTQMVADIDSGKLSPDKADEIARTFAAMGGRCATAAGLISAMTAIVRRRLNANAPPKEEKAKPIASNAGLSDLVKGAKAGAYRRPPPWLGGARA